MLLLSNHTDAVQRRCLICQSQTGIAPKQYHWPYCTKAEGDITCTKITQMLPPHNQNTIPWYCTCSTLPERRSVLHWFEEKKKVLNTFLQMSVTMCNIAKIFRLSKACKPKESPEAGTRPLRTTQWERAVHQSYFSFLESPVKSHHWHSSQCDWRAKAKSIQGWSGKIPAQARRSVQSSPADHTYAIPQYRIPACASVPVLSSAVQRHGDDQFSSSQSRRSAYFSAWAGDGWTLAPACLGLLGFIWFARLSLTAAEAALLGFIWFARW